MHTIYKRCKYLLDQEQVKQFLPDTSWVSISNETYTSPVRIPNEMNKVDPASSLA